MTAETKRMERLWLFPFDNHRRDLVGRFIVLNEQILRR